MCPAGIPVPVNAGDATEVTTSGLVPLIHDSPVPVKVSRWPTTKFTAPLVVTVRLVPPESTDTAVIVSLAGAVACSEVRQEVVPSVHPNPSPQSVGHASHFPSLLITPMAFWRLKFQFVPVFPVCPNR